MLSLAGEKRRWVTARRLYVILLTSSILGAVFPVLMILSKLTANQFHYLHEYRDAVPVLDRLLTAIPLLDIERTLPFLAKWSWHDPWDHKVWGAYAPLNAAVFAVVVAFRRRITALFKRIVEWLYDGEPRYPRVLVFGCAVVLVVSYQTKSHLGFFLPGIGGWHYQNQGPAIRAKLPEAITDEDRAVIAANPFLGRALIPENARFLPAAEGYLEGTGMYLHFRGGEVLPANEELIDMVFPEYVFGTSWDEFRLPDQYFQIVKSALANRRAGRRILLPLALAYPNHTPRMPLDYADYPSSHDLERISFWQLWAHVDRERRIQIVKAARKVAIDAP